MNIKKGIGAVVLASAVVKGNTQAQSQSTTVTQETAKTAADCIAAGGKKTYTANRGFIECVPSETEQVTRITTPSSNDKKTLFTQKSSEKSGKFVYTPSTTGGSFSS